MERKHQPVSVVWRGNREAVETVDVMTLDRGANQLHTTFAANNDLAGEKVQDSPQMRLTGTEQEGKRKPSKEWNRVTSCVTDRENERKTEMSSGET